MVLFIKITDILETATIDALILCSTVAIFIPLRMSLKQPQGD